MKLFLFHAIEKWDERSACAIVAENKVEARRIYASLKGDLYEGWDIEEVSIQVGLCILPHGHDHIEISYKQL